MPLYFDFDFVELRGLAEPRFACRPVKFMNNGMSKQMQRAGEIINAHPESTDAEDVEAAVNLGMRFGPDKKDAVLRVFPLKQLTSLYGPLRIKKAVFSVTSSKEAGAYFTNLRWWLTIQEVGTSRSLWIAVEPFKGRVTSITE